MVDNFQIPPNNSPGQSINVNDIQNVQIEGYTDANSPGDLIDQNQQRAQVIPGGPDPYSQSVIDAYNAQFAPQAIGPQGNAALYPGLSLPEAMGNYSGSIVGSNTLFAPAGGIMAMDPVLARRKAIEDAAKARASSLVPMEPVSPYQLKDQAFQKSLNDKFFEFDRMARDEAKEKYNKDWTVVLSNPSTKEGREYIQGLANFEYMGKNFDQITDDIAFMQEALQEGTLNFTEAGIQAFEDYKALVGSFEGGDFWTKKDIGQLREKLQGFTNLEYKINQGDFLDNIMSEQTAWASSPSDKGDYYVMREGTKKSYDKAIEQVANQMMNASDVAYAVRRGYYTREDIVDALKSRLKNQVTSDASMQQKSAATRGAETEEFVVDSDAVVKYADEDGKRGQVLMPTYDPVTGRVVQGETWSAGSLVDIGVSLTHKPTNIKERNPETGKVQEITTRGIPMDNIMVMNPDGSKRVIPGNVFLEMNDQTISVLDDGTIVAKSTVMVPTKTTLPGEDGELGEGLDFDTYTPQDHLVLLESGSGDGYGGTLTKLKQRGIKSEDVEKAFNERLQQGRDYAKKKIDDRTSGQSKEEELRNKYNY